MDEQKQSKNPLSKNKINYHFNLKYVFKLDIFLLSTINFIIYIFLKIKQQFCIYYYLFIIFEVFFNIFISFYFINIF